MLLFCNYLEAHIMMYDIKLIRVFLSCYKRILLSHQIIVSSRTQFFSSTLLFFHTSLPLSSSPPTSLLHTLPAILHKEEIKEIKAGVEEKKKTQGMRRNSAHFCGVFIIFRGVLLHHFFSIIFFSPHIRSSPPPIQTSIKI